MGPSTYRRSNALAGTRSRPAELFSSAAAGDLWRWVSWVGRWPWSAGACRFSRRDPRNVRPCSPCPRHRSRRVNEAGTAVGNATATATATATAKFHRWPRSNPFYSTHWPAAFRAHSPYRCSFRSLPTHPRSSTAVNRFTVSSTPEYPTRLGEAEPARWDTRQLVHSPARVFSPSLAKRHTTWAAFADTKHSTRFQDQPSVVRR